MLYSAPQKPILSLSPSSFFIALGAMSCILQNSAPAYASKIHPHVIISKVQVYGQPLGSGFNLSTDDSRNNSFTFGTEYLQADFKVSSESGLALSDLELERILDSCAEGPNSDKWKALDERVKTIKRAERENPNSQEIKDDISILTHKLIDDATQLLKNCVQAGLKTPPSEANFASAQVRPKVIENYHRRVLEGSRSAPISGPRPALVDASPKAGPSRRPMLPTDHPKYAAAAARPDYAFREIVTPTAAQPAQAFPPLG